MLWFAFWIAHGLVASLNLSNSMFATTTSGFPCQGEQPLQTSLLDIFYFTSFSSTKNSSF
jgi:hypothetical protein